MPAGAKANDYANRVVSLISHIKWGARSGVHENGWVANMVTRGTHRNPWKAISNDFEKFKSFIRLKVGHERTKI